MLAELYRTSKQQIIALVYMDGESDIPSATHQAKKFIAIVDLLKSKYQGIKFVFKKF